MWMARTRQDQPCLSSVITPNPNLENCSSTVSQIRPNPSPKVEYSPENTVPPQSLHFCLSLIWPGPGLAFASLYCNTTAMPVNDPGTGGSAGWFLVTYCKPGKLVCYLASGRPLQEAKVQENGDAIGRGPLPCLPLSTDYKYKYSDILPGCRFGPNGGNMPRSKTLFRSAVSRCNTTCTNRAILAHLSSCYLHYLAGSVLRWIRNTSLHIHAAIGAALHTCR